jgi:predicted RNA-binding Zn ribbon-like protein
MSDRPWTALYDEEPGGRAPAPGVLRLVQAFLNTVDIEAANDGFTDPAAVRSWFLGQGLISPRARVGDSDRRLAIATREALRDVVGATTGVRVAPSSIRILNRIGRSGVTVRFEANGRARLVASRSNLVGGLASILAAVERSIAEGTWPYLKVCRRDACRWVFFDRSKNHSGSWCTMAICGSRAKAAAYYARTTNRAAFVGSG